MLRATIRRAGIDDVEVIARFQTHCWEQTYRGLVPDSYLDHTTWRVRSVRWQERVAGGARHVWVAELVGAQLVGVASTTHSPTDHPDLPRLELNSIYVDAAAHGTGIAAELLTAAIADQPAHLWVFTANLRAQRFYAKHGFNATGETCLDPGTSLVEERWIRHDHLQSSADSRPAHHVAGPPDRAGPSRGPSHPVVSHNPCR